MLVVDKVSVQFQTGGKQVLAVDGVSLTVGEGESFALVGESGCGKTTLARAILGLQPLTSGCIAVNGEPLQRNRLAEQIGIVWQDPYASLDPRWTIGRSLAEPGKLMGRAVDLAALMSDVGLDPSLADRYPHQLSGGQRQRVAIGRALALRPPLVILDEPTAALDLSIQAQILNLLKDIQQQTKTSFLYISHDLLTVRYIANRVAVMLRGQIVEEGPVDQIFDHPTNEYTRTLLDAAPKADWMLTGAHAD
ncbi:MAG: ABC transporter ATP-binding protein [Armatimonadetes bacterium]|nr:ABC transporter ATP-binding protein [Armatimonadota bacterium]